MRFEPCTVVDFEGQQGVRIRTFQLANSECVHASTLQCLRPERDRLSGVPATQVTDNRGIVYSCLLAQLTKRGFGGCFPCLEGAFDQLHACQRMAKQKDAGPGSTRE